MMPRVSDQLGDQSKTDELFLELDKKNGALTAAAYHFAQLALLNAKEYEVCGRYVDPDVEFKQLASLYEITSAMGQKKPDLLARANNTLTNSVSYLVALLTVTDKKEKAAAIDESAKMLRDDKGYHRAIDEALKGTFPKSSARFP